MAEQPDPKGECRECIKDALKTQQNPDSGLPRTTINCLLSPVTEWLLNLQMMLDGGCKLDPNDLSPATWNVLGVIKREISVQETERMRERRHKK